jgi:hypothetical protein
MNRQETDDRLCQDETTMWHVPGESSMSDGEQKLADTKGKFVQVVKDGRKRNDIDWLAGRIILSNRRLVFVSSEGKRTIALSNITGITGRDNVNKAIAKVSGYLSLQIGSNVTLVAPQDIESFEATRSSSDTPPSRAASSRTRSGRRVG